MSQYAFYPPASSGGGGGSNASVGLTNATAPTSATLAGGVGSGGLLVPLTLDLTGNLNVNLATTALDLASATNQGTEITLLTSIRNSVANIPAAPSTAALQTSGNTTLTAISGKLPATLGQKTSANSLAVVIASDQSTVPVSAASLPLPAGAATSALQTTGNTSLSSIATNTSNTATNTSSTATNTSAISGKLPAVLGQTTSAASLAVVLASDQSPVPVANTQAGKTSITLVRVDYSSTPITTGAYVTIATIPTKDVSEISVFDSSGQTLVLAFHTVFTTIDQAYIFPGGNGTIPLLIPLATVVQVKAISADATVGELIINFLG